MKTSILFIQGRLPSPRLLCVAALLTLLAGARETAAQTNYTVDWWTTDGGGGTSTGGVYSVSGTIGQPDAGTMSGGSFTLQGGFWGVVAAVPTPGAPYLSVTRTNNTVLVCWPGPDSGWKLHFTTSLVSGGSSWTELAPPYSVQDANLVYTEAAPAGNKFYRLHKP
jgi:hypothetical protein